MADEVHPPSDIPDMADVQGQPVARRAMEIAAAGGHHLHTVAVNRPGDGLYGGLEAD